MTSSLEPYRRRGVIHTLTHFAQHPIRWFEQEAGNTTMAAPTNVAVVLDKSTYNPGETITATVTWESGEAIQTATFTGTFTVTNQNGESASAEVQFSVATAAPTDTFTVSASDEGNRTWTVTESNGTSAVLTTEA